MHVHPKASGHEAHGANFVGGRKKPPHNPDEVGAVKDHFSEGRQQENKRQPPKQNPPSQAEAIPLAVPNAPHDNPWQASHALAAKGAALALQSLLKDAAPETDQGKQTVAAPPEPAKDPSLDDLLALMRTKS